MKSWDAASAAEALGVAVDLGDVANIEVVRTELAMAKSLALQDRPDEAVAMLREREALLADELPEDDELRVQIAEAIAEL